MNVEETTISKIVEKTGMHQEEILSKIEKKEEEFSGLVSRLGAIYIVGKDLGIDLVKPVNKDLKIKNIVSNMRNVNFVGKLVNISPIREFETERGPGKVVNLTFADETGSIRLSLWNEKTEVVDDLKNNEVLEVINGYTRIDNLGNPEVRLSRYGNLRRVKGVDIQVVKTEKKQTTGYKEVKLNEIGEDDFVSVKATILQIYERKPIHTFCSVCRAKIEESCQEHKDATPEKMLIVSGVIDDGYGNINIVFFRNTAESILEKSTEDVEKELKDKGDKDFFRNNNVCGKSFVVVGVVRKNMFNNMEMVAHKVKKFDVKNEINVLIGDLND